MKMKTNYVRLKENLESEKMQKVLSVFVQAGRKLNQPIWILSSKYKKEDGSIWFKGISVFPNTLIQSIYWPTQVVPGNHFIIDLTQCLNTAVLEGGIKIVVNPSRLYWTNHIK